MVPRSVANYWRGRREGAAGHGYKGSLAKESLTSSLSLAAQPAPSMLRSLLILCLVGLAPADNYDAPQPICAPGQEILTVTNTHVNTVVDTVTVYDYHLKPQVVDVTSLVMVPSPLLVDQTFPPLDAQNVPTITTHLTNTVYHTTYHTVQATAAVTTTSILVATNVQVVGTITLTVTAVVPQPVTETQTTHALVTALTTVTTTTEGLSISVKVVENYSTLTATRMQVVPVPATRTVTSTDTSVVEATVTSTQYDLLTLCYSPMITFQH